MIRTQDRKAMTIGGMAHCPDGQTVAETDGELHLAAPAVLGSTGVAGHWPAVVEDRVDDPEPATRSRSPRPSIAHAECAAQAPGFLT